MSKDEITKKIIELTAVQNATIEMPKDKIEYMLKNFLLVLEHELIESQLDMQYKEYEI